VVSILTNIAGERARFHLSRVTRDLADTTERLSSGELLRSETMNFFAADLLELRIRGVAAAAENVQKGVSALTIADAALDSINDEYLARLIEIAIEAADGLTTDAQRAILNAEFQQIKTSINSLIDESTFQGRNLLDGSQTAAFTLQTGSASGATYTIDFTTNFRTDAGEGKPLSVLGASGAGLGVASQGDATGALAELTGTASSPPNISVAFANARVKITVQYPTLSSIADIADFIGIELEEARDALVAADIAAETSRLIRDQLLADSGASALANSGFGTEQVVSALATIVGRG